VIVVIEALTNSFLITKIDAVFEILNRSSKKMNLNFNYPDCQTLYSFKVMCLV